MNPFLVLAIVLGASAIAVGILVLLRRRRPEGWWVEPTAMRHTIDLIEHDPTFAEGGFPHACDVQGAAAVRAFVQVVSCARCSSCPRLIWSATPRTADAR